MSDFFFDLPLLISGPIIVGALCLYSLAGLRIFALDRPFRGDLALPPAPYQLVFDQLMKP